MTPHMKQFLRDILEWIEAGCPDHEVFNGGHGLCISYHRYGGNPDDMEDNFSSKFPFGGREAYISEMKEGTMYQNPQRLTWIREHANAS